jgi:5-oxoprolinase (ATP-hydrolysing)/N-methylhydantoinase B
MRFSDNGYYIERYIKCDNCGVLLYEDGLKGEVAGEAKLFCSDWCQQWASARTAGVDEPRIPLPREGIHKAG